MAMVAAMTILRRLFLLLVLTSLAPMAAAAERGPLILAAASLQESLTDAADAWAAQGHARPVLSFAGSSALARQIMAGAPADLFISADEPWMDAVAKAGLLRPGTRANLVGNRLVLIAPRASRPANASASSEPSSPATAPARVAVGRLC